MVGSVFCELFKITVINIGKRCYKSLYKSSLQLSHHLPEMIFFMVRCSLQLKTMTHVNHEVSILCKPVKKTNEKKTKKS